MIIHETADFINYKYKNPTPQWMKEERLDYCEQVQKKELHVGRILSQILFSIFF